MAVKKSTVFNKTLKEIEAFLSISQVEYDSIKIQSFESVSALKQDNEYFEAFTNCILHDSFRSVFGWQIATTTHYLFFVKKNTKSVLYVEVERKATSSTVAG